MIQPDTVIEPYDTQMASLSLTARRALAADVVRDLEAALGPLAGRRIEMHAGEEYVQAVGPTLRARGATMLRPLKGLRLGEQLHWYGDELGREPGRRPGGPENESSAISSAKPGA